MKLTCPLCGKKVHVVPSQGDYSAFLRHHKGLDNKQCAGSGMSEGAAKWANEQKDTPDDLNS